MQTFPVFAAMGAAYRLLIRELPTVVRLTWAPLAVVAIVQYLSARYIIGEMAAALAQGDWSAGTNTDGYRGWLPLRTTIEMVGTAIVAVALHELALFGDRKRATLLYMSFGRRELRFLLLAPAFGFAIVGLMMLFLLPAGKNLMAYAGPAAAVAMIVVFYLSLRLWPIFPIIVVKNRFAFREAWTLTRGRFWSLAALGIVGMLPVLLVSWASEYALPDFQSVATASGSLGEKRRMLELAQAWLPLRSALDFTASILHTAVGVFLISYGYKALTGHTLEEPLPSPLAAS